MELRHLKYFVAIAEERSFTRAAERLWIAQPGLSTQIRRLEAELGVTLLVRHTRGVDLTAAGKIFLDRARVALAAAEEASTTGSDLASGVVGSLRIGLSAGPAWSRTPALLETFHDALPGVEVTVTEAQGGTLWRELRDGRLDALVAPTSFASPDLRVLDLGAEPWVVLVGRDHALFGETPLDSAELDGFRVLTFGHRDAAAYDRAVESLLTDLGVAAAVSVSGPGPAALKAVQDGRVLAITTAPVALPAGVTARPLEPERTLAFELMWRDEECTPALSELLAMAAAAAGRERPAPAFAGVA